jgi:hypothetical protein
MMTPRRTPLFILSHMRSYSSVLSHVLGSHPEIDGYCETHLRYRLSLDFMRLKWRVRRLTGEPLRGRMVLDKILHNYALTPSLLHSPDTQAVFLLRQPVEVLQSIIHMGTHLDANERHADAASATTYYVERVRRLAKLAPLLGARAAFVESNQLLSHTDHTLNFLTHFLGLDTPLDRRYRRFPRTGRPGSGDPSPAIFTGELASGELGARREKKPRYSIPSALIAKAVEAHAECLAACNYHCVPVSAAPRRAVGREQMSLAG